MATSETSNLNININLGSVLKFSLPSIVSTVIFGIFGVVDTILISRFIDMESLAAANLTMPILTSTMAVGFMIATGGSALVATKKGEGREVEARENFSLLIYVSFLFSAIAAILCLLFLEPLLRFLGVNDGVMALSKEYIVPIITSIPFIMMGFVFQKFLIADGKPTFAMIVSSLGGAASMGLSFFFITRLDMGLLGTSLGTVIGLSLPAVVGFVYFTFFRKSGLYFVKPKFVWNVLTKSTTNGISEFITMMAVTVTSTFMNNIIMDIEGPLGVAAVGIMMALQGIVTSLFMGYSFGISPIISYNYGKGDTDALKKTYALSLKIVGGLSLLSILIGVLFASPLTRIFVNPADSPVDLLVYEMAVYGMRIVSLSFLLMAFNTFATGLFTALNNGWVSGVMSFFRTLVFLVVSLLLLPRIFEMNGIWLALPFAEILSIFMTVYYLRKMNGVYQYGKEKNPKKLALKKANG